MTPISPLVQSTHSWRVRCFQPIQHRASNRPPRYRRAISSRACMGKSEGSCQPRSTWQKVGIWIATTGFAVGLSFTFVTHSVLAVSNEQLLFLEAWRAVDRAYYDKNFNGKSWFKIRENYIKDKALSTRQETYAAIRELLAELEDPFTRFLEPSRYAALKRGTAGSVTGVGLEVGFDMDVGSESNLMVITPSADGPADKAGIKPRDGVIAIDGKPTAGTSLYEAGDQLQGPEGSQVTLTIKPADGAEQREVQLMRQRIINNPVSSQLCQKVPLGEITDVPETFGKVGYIRVATFSKQTTDNVKTALHKLQAEKANMIVLDIRNNGGGLFPAGVEVARTLMNEGDIVLIADSQGVRDSYPASNVAVEPKTPLSVLVNRGTASASEVLAGALQDNGRAKIVGEKTFGKGLIQTIVELSDGSGVAITVARYQTPLGTDINKKGIQPDILINNGDMPPTNGAGFCKYVASKGAAVLFDAKAAAKMPSDGLRPEGAGDSMPIDVTQYENSFISGQPSEAVPQEKTEKESIRPPTNSSPTPSEESSSQESPDSKAVTKAEEGERESGAASASESREQSQTDDTSKQPQNDQGGLRSRSKAEEQDAAREATSAQPHKAGISRAAESRLSISEPPQKVEGPSSMPEGGKPGSQSDKRSSSSSEEQSDLVPGSKTSPEAKQGEGTKNEPPVSDSPAPVREVNTPEREDIAPRPVARDSPVDSAEKAGPTELTNEGGM